MPEVNGFEAGRFCWAEAATTDVAAAKTFYMSLFGWDAEDNDIPGGGVYTMFKLGDRYVGAVAEQQETERAQGVPPHWNLYVSVDDADAYVKRAQAAGGSILAPAFDVMDAGRMAIVADPTGAVFGVWQAGLHRGFGRVGDAGSPTWHELLTSDIEAARTFYTETFGWDAADFPTPDGRPYTIFQKDQEQVGGAMTNPPGTEGMPAHWMIYYAVDDCAASADKVKELGGQIYFGPQAVENVGTFATCADPRGAAFSLLEPDPAMQQQ